MSLSLDLVSYWLIQIRAKNNHIFVTLIISKVAHSDSMKAFRKVLIFSFVTIFALLFILGSSSIFSSAYAPMATRTKNSALVYVENAESGSVSVISGTEVIKTISVGMDPLAQMAYTPSN